eukprot:CAMPEP_0171227026 /NCGR_PEP_ID=MMETSP0790-20130122/37627_1 /TAXON_ID=2925 /ORGANISM="Alexandrium catenella, Strain OF101" /LENGTH=107 /DNA_ID=CAMNT_0011693111 /DNA_START=321 /DNA_END=645 /DNA_ORIENTATION=-
MDTRLFVERILVARVKHAAACRKVLWRNAPPHQEWQAATRVVHERDGLDEALKIGPPSRTAIRTLAFPSSEAGISLVVNVPLEVAADVMVAVNVSFTPASISRFLSK